MGCLLDYTVLSVPVPFLWTLNFEFGTCIWDLLNLRFGGAQMFRLNTEGQLSSGEWCVAGDRADNINIAWCPQGSNAGPWQYREDTSHLLNTRTGKCLAVHPDSR